jgi:hypothetical protein
MTQPPPASLEPGAKIVCPFCASAETELFSMFSQFLLASQYYCRSCKTVFDVVRWDEPAQTAPSEEGQAHLSGVRSSHPGGAGDKAG